MKRSGSSTRLLRLTLFDVRDEGGSACREPACRCGPALRLRRLDGARPLPPVHTINMVGGITRPSMSVATILSLFACTPGYSADQIQALGLAYKIPARELRCFLSPEQRPGPSDPQMQ